MLIDKHIINKYTSAIDYRGYTSGLFLGDIDLIASFIIIDLVFFNGVVIFAIKNNVKTIIYALISQKKFKKKLPVPSRNVKIAKVP